MDEKLPLITIIYVSHVVPDATAVDVSTVVVWVGVVEVVEGISMKINHAYFHKSRKVSGLNDVSGSWNPTS